MDIFFAVAVPVTGLTLFLLQGKNPQKEILKRFFLKIT